MITLKEALTQVIKENNFIEDALYNDYLNLTWFAIYIKPYIDNKLQKQISISSIKMALSRYSYGWVASRKQKILLPKDFYIKDNISIFYIENNCKNYQKILALYEKLEKQNSYFSFINWSREISVITNICNPDIKDYKLKLENLVIIWVYLPEDFLYQKWMFYHITKQLLFHNINIVEIVSTYTEISVIIDKKDLKTAFNALCIK